MDNSVFPEALDSYNLLEIREVIIPTFQSDFNIFIVWTVFARQCARSGAARCLFLPAKAELPYVSLHRLTYGNSIILEE